MRGYQKLFEFEQALCDFTGAPFCVVTDGCTHGIELAMRYYQVSQCSLPAYTYLSVVQTLHQLDIEYQLIDMSWQGEYQFEGTNIWDSARRLEPGMYRPGQVQCLSFGNTKPLQIGKCGAVLLDDIDAYNHISMTRSDGRDLRIDPWQNQKVFPIGYHYMPSLEHCELGISLLKKVVPQNQTAVYPDLRKIHIKS